MKIFMLESPLNYKLYLFERIQMNISKSSADLYQNNNSLKEALAIMKGLGSKKSDSRLTAHNMAKQIYEYTLSYAKNTCSNAIKVDEISNILQTPEATCQILAVIKQNLKIILFDSLKKQAKNDGKDNSSQQTTQSSLISQIKQRDHKIKALQALMQESQKNFKHVQLKLLNSIKKMNLQIQQKQLQMNQLKEIVAEKQEELESLQKVNEKKYRRIRQLEEDVYDLQAQLEKTNEELIAERNCSVILEKKLDKIIDQSIISDNHQNQKQFNLAAQMAKNQIGTQTEQQKLDEENTSILCQSRQSQYLQSIERLATQLSEAYQRISELTKDERSATERKHLTNLTKPKTSSTYFVKKN